MHAVYIENGQSLICSLDERWKGTRFQKFVSPSCPTTKQFLEKFRTLYEDHSGKICTLFDKLKTDYIVIGELVICISFINLFIRNKICQHFLWEKENDSFYQIQYNWDRSATTLHMKETELIKAWCSQSLVFRAESKQPYWLCLPQ